MNSCMLLAILIINTVHVYAGGTGGSTEDPDKPEVDIFAKKLNEIEEKADVFEEKISAIGNKLDKLLQYFDVLEGLPVDTTTTTTNYYTNTEEGILITGGDGGGLNVEVFIPATGQNCSYPRLPSSRDRHTLNMVGSTPVLCGGGGQDSDGNSCIQLYPPTREGRWTQYATTLEPRNRHTSWVSSEGLLLVGGHNTHWYYTRYILYTGNTTELVPSGGFRFTPRQALWNACTIGFADTMIVTGGGPGNITDDGGWTNGNLKWVSQYNLQGLVKNLPDMNEGRRSHGCGTYRSNGEMVLVVAGGYNLETYISSVEKMVLHATGWTYTKPLPWALGNMASVSLGDKIYLIGGHDTKKYPEDSRRAEILSFDGEEWKEVGEIQESVWNPAATKITTNDVNGLCG